MDVPSIQADDVLMVVDVQNDFFAGGSLAIPGAEGILSEVNRWLDAAVSVGATIVLVRDWHPVGHKSFLAHGGPWPTHCVQGSSGAELHPRLHVPRRFFLASKGTDSARDTYSAFEDSRLLEELRGRKVGRVWLCGVALDYCVRATGFDVLRAGYELRVIVAATRAVDSQAGQRALDELRAAGAILEGETRHDSQRP